MNDHIPDLTKMIGETPCNATPREELRNQIMSSVIPKNEREWWANRTIEQLERELNAATSEIARLTSKVAQLYEGAEEQNQRIKRLEEAGGVIKASLKRSLNPNEQGECKWLAELPMTDAEFAVFTTAFKAKEAKP
jgi:predicted RNase H-like nuclease (RuvC/YqgF family)